MPAAADEIRALAITLNGMLDRLAAGRERQRSFVADAAHELRSPLASMRAQLEVAERLGEGGSLPADLLADLARLSGLVEDLLLLARSDADTRPPIRPALIDGRDLLVEVADGYVGQRVPVTVRTGPAVMIWPTRRNCAERSTTWWPMPSGMRIPASSWPLRSIGTRCVLRVTDDGPGWPSRIDNGCSSGSPDSTTPGPATPAVRGWGWPSCRNWSGARAARWP